MINSTKSFQPNFPVDLQDDTFIILKTFNLLRIFNDILYEQLVEMVRLLTYVLKFGFKCEEIRYKISNSV